MGVWLCYSAMGVMPCRSEIGGPWHCGDLVSHVCVMLRSFYILNSFYVRFAVLFLVTCLSEFLLNTASSMSLYSGDVLFFFSSRLSLDYLNCGYYRHSYL